VNRHNLPKIAGVKAMHAPEKRPKKIANTTVPASFFIAAIQRTIIPVPTVKNVPRLKTPKRGAR